MPKKNKSKENSSSVGENFFVVSPEKKKKLLGIFLVILALLIFLSILTYSRYDESYFSIIFPVIMFIWGYSILRKVGEYKLPLYLSNFLVVMGILLSTFFGMIQ